MVDIIEKNPLQKPLFKDELDFKILENMLEPLKSVEVKKITREKFNELDWKFLQETWQNKFWNQYILHLPEDLLHWELIYFINFLSEKFNIIDYAELDKIFTHTKVMICSILREENWEEILDTMKEEFHFSDEFINKITSKKMTFSEAKKLITKIKSDRSLLYTHETDQKFWKHPTDNYFWLDSLQDLYSQEFDLTFFRDSQNMLRSWMEIITQAEVEKKVKTLINRWFEKVDGVEHTYYTKDDQTAALRVETSSLEESSQLLRDAIWIDSIKAKLRDERESWNQEQIAPLELEATQKILEELYKFPYFFTNDQHWYQPSKILEHKENYCLWFSLLWSSFLTELWIKHNWLRSSDHSALGVTINKKEYFFDPTNYSKLLDMNHIPYKYSKNNNDCFEVNMPWTEWATFFEYWPADKELLSQLLWNKLNHNYISRDEYTDVKAWLESKSEELGPIRHTQYL